MINLMPIGGLCNRLRVIESGIRLARECGSALRLYWLLHPVAMREYYSDIFEALPDDVDLIERAGYGLFSRVLFSRLNPRRFRPERCVEFVEYCRKRRAPIGTAHFNYAEFCVDVSRRDYSWLKPRAFIRDRVETESGRMGANAIGLHVRRTDNAWAIENSPLELFERAIDREIRADGDARFFLATDDEKTRERLCRLYPDRILTRTDVKNRNDRGGVADATLDLMLLARTRKIYGSFGSSFSVVASQIGSIPLDILKVASAGEEHDERGNWEHMRRA